MLKSLIINNIALIEHIEIDLNKNLNILSGETGAGKSIILGALSAVLGDKVSPDIVRTGESDAFVEAIFDISSIKMRPDIFDELEISADDEEIIIRRDISSDGKSKCKINARSVLLSQVRDVSDALVDIHSQHEHQSLLNIEKHLTLLDAFARNEQMLSDFAVVYNELIRKKAKLNEIVSLEKEKERILELSRYANEEIDSLKLNEGEDDEIEEELKRLNSFQKLAEVTNDAYKEVYKKDGSAIHSVERLIEHLGEVSSYDNKLAALIKEAEEVLFRLENVKESLKDYRDNLEFSQDRIDDLNARSFKIRDLKRKYSCADVKELISYSKMRAEEVSEIENSTKIKEGLSLEIKELEKRVSELSSLLSKSRQAAAKKLSAMIEKELFDLGITKGKFAVEFKYVEDEESFLKINGRGIKLTAKGIDRVEFLISANAGEKLRPLKKIASGGELSRIMLALKSVLADLDEIFTLVFDEIDAGIGGETAFNVGRKLKAIGRSKQIICITHLAQIASIGDANYKVYKNENEGRTKTGITKLSDDERIKEVARMLGGEDLTDKSIAHAKELVAKGIIPE
jgi:DNA repair protein RecN (Recombination protein N)